MGEGAVGKRRGKASGPRRAVKFQLHEGEGDMAQPKVVEARPRHIIKIKSLAAVQCLRELKKKEWAVGEESQTGNRRTRAPAGKHNIIAVLMLSVANQTSNSLSNNVCHASMDLTLLQGWRQVQVRRVLLVL